MTLPLHQAFVLHARAYRDTSLLLELFTVSQGRISAVMRGCRRPKSTTRPLLQPFVPLFISYFGRGELVTMSTVEANGFVSGLEGRKLWCGLYINELLLRLLGKHDPHPDLFETYRQTLVLLSEVQDPEAALRHFELNLLQELGYGLELTYEAKTGFAVEAEALYHFTPHVGLERIHHQLGLPETAGVFEGRHLLAFARKDWQQAETLKTAKRILRLAIANLLEGRAIHSRELFKVEDSTA